MTDGFSEEEADLSEDNLHAVVEDAELEPEPLEEIFSVESMMPSRRRVNHPVMIVT